LEEKNLLPIKIPKFFHGRNFREIDEELVLYFLVRSRRIKLDRVKPAPPVTRILVSFLVEFIGHADTVILRSITPPSMDELKGLMAQAEEIARKAGMKKKDLNSAIKKVRRKK
jgi:hypothetical protein